MKRTKQQEITIATRNAIAEAIITSQFQDPNRKPYDVAMDIQSAIDNAGFKMAVKPNFCNSMQDIPVAACNKCGGWTNHGGMSQHYKSKVPILGRIGCTC